MSYCIQSIPTFLKNFHVDLSTRSLLKKSTENKVPSMVHMWRVLLRGIHTRKNMQFFIQHSDMKMLNAITKADFTRPLPAGIYEASAETL